MRIWLMGAVSLSLILLSLLYTLYNPYDIIDKISLAIFTIGMIADLFIRLWGSLNKNANNGG